ncbi:MAG: inositol monophosphatase [Verrucomicrobia bacterium]|nr:inositol monophosphatase [Verrucomicrobiota bacterium]
MAARPQFPWRLQTTKYKTNWTAALEVAVTAARAAGRVMRQELARPKRVDLATQHDIKLALDVQCQQLIQHRLLQAYPASRFFGEEGSVGDAEADWRWVVDPIDGTVNFTYGIPHACVSIALQERRVPRRKPRGRREAVDKYETVVGVVHDPFADELWTAIRGARARLNGRPARVSQRARLEEAMVSLGFGKRDAVLQHLLPAFRELTPRVRKLRIMGSAALALTYVATGRFDAYAEVGLGLWDFAAGALIVECAGGEVRTRELPDGLHEVVATNGRLSRPLRRFLPDPLSA